MKIEDLEIGSKYLIDFKIARDPWKGEARFISFNPPNFPPGTLEFICLDNNVYGYFSIEEVVEKISEEGYRTITLKDSEWESIALVLETHKDGLLVNKHAREAAIKLCGIVKRRA
jgi:hypothetical protein